MSQHTTQQLIDMIRRGDRLGHRMMQTIATRLEEAQAENERLQFWFSTRITGALEVMESRENPDLVAIGVLQRTLEGVGNGN